jgi:hypothetical protein
MVMLFTNNMTPEFKEDDNLFIKGFRNRNRSVKIYETVNDKYLVVRTEYFMKFKIRKKRELYDSLDQAEDVLLELRYDGYAERMRKYWHIY